MNTGSLTDSYKKLDAIESADDMVFSIGIRDHYAFDLNIWVSSPQRILGGVEKLDIEICESIDESVFYECYGDLIQGGFKPTQNIMEFSPKKSLNF